MQRLPLSQTLLKRLLSHLARQARVLGPRREADGVVRWGEVTAWSELAPPGELPQLPPKVWLLPSPELLWTESGAGFVAASPDEAIVLVGIAPCDLAGIAWLDQAGADDGTYSRRRRLLRLVGRACRPTEGCSCPPQVMPPPFDLFADDDWLWSGSAWGDGVLAELAESPVAASASVPETHAGGESPPPPLDLLARFRAGQDAPIWAATAARCLACGACSVVCPTCNCFDVVDSTPLAGPVRRSRVADNCFFRDHALVAGGHNFRPDRTARLKFRFEHKLLGFGSLRGESSCVGCGRCVRACPARIDLRDVWAGLPAVTEGGG